MVVVEKSLRPSTVKSQQNRIELVTTPANLTGQMSSSDSSESMQQEGGNKKLQRKSSSEDSSDFSLGPRATTTNAKQPPPPPQPKTPAVDPNTPAKVESLPSKENIAASNSPPQVPTQAAPTIQEAKPLPATTTESCLEVKQSKVLQADSVDSFDQLPLDPTGPTTTATPESSAPGRRLDTDEFYLKFCMGKVIASTLQFLTTISATCRWLLPYVTSFYVPFLFVRVTTRNSCYTHFLIAAPKV